MNPTSLRASHLTSATSRLQNTQTPSGFQSVSVLLLWEKFPCDGPQSNLKFHVVSIFGVLNLHLSLHGQHNLSNGQKHRTCSTKSTVIFCWLQQKIVLSRNQDCCGTERITPCCDISYSIDGVSDYSSDSVDRMSTQRPLTFNVPHSQHSHHVHHTLRRSERTWCFFFRSTSNAIRTCSGTRPQMCLFMHFRVVSHVSWYLVQTSYTSAVYI